MSISSGPSHITPGIPDLNPQWSHTQDIHSEEEMEEEMEEEEDEDEEVDELASASEAEEEANGPGGGKDPGRVPGHTLLPTVRIENILQADGGTGSMSLSKEGLFLLSIATEEFIKRMARGGHRQANVQRRNVITYIDMADTTRQYQEFMFLRDIIPEPLGLADALALRDAKARGFFEEEEEPSISKSAAASTSYSFAPAASASSSKSKSTKGRSTNGKEKANGSSSKKEHSGGASSRGQPPAWGGQGAGVLDARPWTHWCEPNAQTTAVHQEMNGSQTQANGHAPTSSASHSGSITPTHTADAPVDDTSAEGWTTHTGPASGFLQGPGHNTGRTIYSQQTHS